MDVRESMFSSKKSFNFLEHALALTAGSLAHNEKSLPDAHREGSNLNEAPLRRRFMH
jgi:hypothetical protein